MSIRPLVLTAAVLALAPAAAAGAASTTVLRLDGIGPLKLGMSRADAVATGWLGSRGTGCKLGGPPYPITYRFTGFKAPSGLRGNAEFVGGKLLDMAFSNGVHTATGVTIGRTTPARMVASYRNAGLSVSSAFSPTFGGTFVTVKRAGKPVLGAFATKGAINTIAIPSVPVCE